MAESNGDGIPLPPDLLPPKFDRATIRVQVARDQAELREVAKAGGNVHQRSLDQLDRTRSQIAHLSVDDQTRFLRVYAEETRAAAAVTNDEALALEAQVASKQSFSEQIGRGLVGALIILALFGLCAR